MKATTRTDQAAGPSRVRRHDIDWVRILAVLLLIPFHTARIFNLEEAGVAEPFYAKSQALSWPLSHLINFLDGWQMPLLFAVAGAATWYALGFRSGGQYAAERFKRLLIPFIFGVLVIVPPQTFFGSISNHNYDGSFLGYWPHFFTDESDGTGYAGGFTPAHLWFIAYLFLFAVLGLPLMLYFRRGSGARLVSRIAAFCQRPGAIFLFAVPLLAASYLVSDAVDPNPLRHLLFFLAGYLMVADGRFQDAIDRHKGTALLIGIASAAVLNTVWATGVDLGGNFAPQMVGVKLLGNLNAWLWIVAILGYGRQFLNVNNRVLRYANEAAYPFYILHQTVIVAIGFYVLKWGLPVPAAFTFIALASLVASLALYDLLVKRVGVLRLLFGMKQAPAARRVVQRQAVPAMP
jgi:peptidoglycan/LPS O-acetylase OafA/YrhL